MNLFYFLIVEGGMKPERDRADLDELLADQPDRRRTNVAKVAALGGDIR